MKKEILILGAGAVGLVYGKHFVDGNHHVTFYVREKYRNDMEQGSVLYHMNNDKSLKKPIHFKNYDVVTSFEEIHKKQWDQIYLSFSSTALQSFDFDSFKEHLLGEPTIVMLQASTEDRDLLLSQFPEDRIVQGMITLISYAAPLATETVEIPGTSYWLPPMMPMPISGPQTRRDEVIQTFKSGKINAGKSKSVQNEALFPSAFLPAFLTALESKNWKFKQLKKDTKLLTELKATIGEIFTVLEKEHNEKRPFAFGIISKPFILKILLGIAPKVMPMDLETYFEYHFMKVKDQTKMYMHNYQLLAEKQGTPHTILAKFNTLT